MAEQMTLFDVPKKDTTDFNQKRRWENAFQKWSDNFGYEDGNTPYGACGYGSMCDYCGDNTYGRPCVRALNAMCREKNMQIDYTDFEFTKVWWKGTNK